MRMISLFEVHRHSMKIFRNQVNDNEQTSRKPSLFGQSSWISKIVYISELLIYHIRESLWILNTKGGLGEQSVFPSSLREKGVEYLRHQALEGLHPNPVRLSTSSPCERGTVAQFNPVLRGEVRAQRFFRQSPPHPLKLELRQELSL